MPRCLADAPARSGEGRIVGQGKPPSTRRLLAGVPKFGLVRRRPIFGAFGLHVDQTAAHGAHQQRVRRTGFQRGRADWPRALRRSVVCRRGSMLPHARRQGNVCRPYNVYVRQSEPLRCLDSHRLAMFPQCPRPLDRHAGAPARLERLREAVGRLDQQIPLGRGGSLNIRSEVSNPRGHAASLKLRRPDAP